MAAGGALWRSSQHVQQKDAITKRKRREADYSPSKPIEAWGTTKTLAAWARDRRAKVGPEAIAARLRRGWTPEDAIGTAVYGRPR